MPRGLDHVVHVVRDLEAAGELYDLLGFTVGTRNRHPWGTHNRIIQTPGFFIELLEIAEPDAIPAHTDTTFSFGAFNRDYLATVGPGLSMLVVESRDTGADEAEFEAAGYGGYEPFAFEREGRRPDGSEVHLGFQLAFARPPEPAQAGFFTCRQVYPANFWSSDLQRHMNGTTAVAGAVLVDEQPEGAALGFVSVLTGTTPRRAIDGWYLGDTPRGVVELMAPSLFAGRYGAVPVGTGLRIGALRLAVKDIAVTRKRLASSRMTAEEIEGMIVVGPKSALGATLVFEPA